MEPKRPPPPQAPPPSGRADSQARARTPQPWCGRELFLDLGLAHHPSPTRVPPDPPEAPGLLGHGGPLRPGSLQQKRLTRVALASECQASEKRRDAEGIRKRTRQLLPVHWNRANTSNSASPPLLPLRDRRRLRTRGKADRPLETGFRRRAARAQCYWPQEAVIHGFALCAVLITDCPAPGRQGRGVRLPGGCSAVPADRGAAGPMRLPLLCSL